ncbi:hypothetical protein [Gloeobacter morelensis]|uniref:hypothetical protein n=1 Tax=Gloeobacter morelensis TaxID=2907343 RepID=UPI001E450428|nr:hypothetical protein [Gloeobacter morelensis]UFP97160.1 hypothetical protein ISF26_23860 [Gloeobacter morelensis MG652769]
MSLVPYFSAVHERALRADLEAFRELRDWIEKSVLIPQVVAQLRNVGGERNGAVFFNPSDIQAYRLVLGRIAELDKSVLFPPPGPPLSEAEAT